MSVGPSQRIDRLFNSNRHSFAKISAAGAVGLILGLRVAWLNRNRIHGVAAVLLVVVISILSMTVAGTLVMADTVRRRVRAEERVSLASRLVFGSGVWSLLLWIIGALIVGTPMAIWLGTLTANRPAG